MGEEEASEAVLQRIVEFGFAKGVEELVGEGGTLRADGHFFLIVIVVIAIGEGGENWMRRRKMKKIKMMVVIVNRLWRFT